MKILLDTHILLWVLAGSPKVDSVKAEILADHTDIYVSAASWWELAIKIGLGKLDANLSELRLAAKDSGFIELAVTGEHTEALVKLPNVHKNPFDRLLVC